MTYTLACSHCNYTYTIEVNGNLRERRIQMDKIKESELICNYCKEPQTELNLGEVK